MLLLTYLLTL